MPTKKTLAPTLALSLLASVAGAPAPAEEGAFPAPPPDQIAAAVLPAPEELRPDATVLGWNAEGRLVTLRDGDGELVCLADDPSVETFHVACYHRDLEPFMARGRELRAEGKERQEVVDARRREIEAGTLQMPDAPRALYSLTAPDGAWEPKTATLRHARRVFVVYVPYATASSTGLSPRQMTPGAPWIMAEGEPWAHIMVVQAPVEPDEGSPADTEKPESDPDGP